jgi:diguanylate cyclase (GGDEF)-like protein/PAS domain S-box-containing protein
MKHPMLEAKLRLGLTDRLPVLSVSDGIEALLGFKPGDFLLATVSLQDRIHPHDSDIAAILFSLEIENQASRFNIRLRHADGRIRCVKATCTREVAPGGEVILDLFLQDAKSLWQAQLDEPTMALFKAMTENTGDFIFFKDRNHVFTAANEPVVPTADSGQRWPDLVGLTDYDLLPEEYADYYYRLEKEVFAGKPAASEVQAAPSRDGKGGWLDNRKYPIRDSNGEIVGLFGIARDVTDRRRVEEALRESKELLQLFIEHAPAALAMFDREMRYMAASGRWLENVSLTGREIIGHRPDEVHRVPEPWKEAHRRGLAGETVRAEEDQYKRADGSVRWLRWEVRPWRTGDGGVGGIIMFSEDITQQMQAEERLRLAASVFTHSREGIVITDLDGNILDVNDTFTRITGYDRDEVLGRNPRLLSSGLHGREFYAEMWRAIKETGQWSGEIWNRHKSGEIYPETLTINALFNESGDVWQYVALFSDISALKEHERKLEHVAHYDILTGLPNRVLLADRLHQAMAHSRRRDQPLAVAFLDLDGFKAVNDRHGHEAGDQLLTSVATRMKQALRDGDTLARLGGDEFVAVLLDMGDIDQRANVLNRLLEAVGESTILGDLVLQVTASLGVTFYPQARDVDADLLLRQADHAMYQAKLAGRNCFHIFDTGNDSIVRGHHEDVALIRKALAAREFVLYFQPMVNMRTGTVVGAEALIRWQLPVRGLMPPAAFLPIIEDDPLAVELGEWVIDSALTQMETWLEAGLDIPVSVNVSAMQLQQANFPDRLRALLAAHPNVKSSSLELEVLETSALQDMTQASQTIHACSEIGVSFALDDFGTGYSSLTYLKRLPSRILKIDQSFVRGILDDAEDLTIIEGVLLLALAFRRMVIAEGVESVEHGMTLLQMGCELAQGYCIARPMPAKDLPSWVASWRPDHRWATAYRERPAKDGSNAKH